jgi:hypothetical protein
MTLRPGQVVTFWDDEGDPHEAVVIDVFARPNAFAPYVNLVYNDSQEEFGANTKSGLVDDTSVGHVVDKQKRKYSYTTERKVL